MAGANWTPLESKPRVMNDFLRKIGVRPGWSMRCIHGLDTQRISVAVPDQTKAVAFVFAYDCMNAGDAADSQEEHDASNPQELFFIQEPATDGAESLTEASEPIALIHGIANGIGLRELDPEGSLAKFIADTLPLTPSERGAALTSDSSTYEELRGLYNTIVCGSPPSACSDPREVTSGADVRRSRRRHVALVRHRGTLYELDPARCGPVPHGASFAATFAQDAARVCQDLLILGNPSICRNHWRFSFFGLVADDDDEIFKAVGGLAAYYGSAARQTNETTVSSDDRTADEQQQEPSAVSSGQGGNGQQQNSTQKWLPLSDDDLIQM